MKCLFCEGTVLKLKENYVCEKCGMIYEMVDQKLVNLFCPECNGELTDGKCLYCETVIVVSDEEEEEVLYCPECGTPLNVDGNCKECGTKIDIAFEE